MILKLVLALTPVLIILIVSELLWRKKIVKGERARKFIHILAGAWIAFWPLYLPFDGIFVLGACALTLLVYSRITRLFHAIYAVKRKTYGDVLFAVGIMLCAFLGRADWVFIVSILFLSLADGAAAVAGRFYGIGNEYFVFGSKHLKKSVIGSLVFLILSVVSVGIGWLMGGEDIISENIVLVFIVLPALATLLENTMPFGLDNVATPLFTTLLLNSLL